VRNLVRAFAALAVFGLVVFAGAGGATGGNGHRHVIGDAASGTLQPAKLTVQTSNGTITKQMPFISESSIIAAKFLGSEEEDKDVAADAASGADFGLAGDATGSGPGSLGCASRDKGKGNKRVNQDCTFRRQAEEDIAFDPSNPTHLTAGQNDSRVGFNQCGIDFSTDNGKHWGDMLPPFRQRFNSPTPPHTIAGGAGTDHTYDFGSDPTVAWDSQGRAFFSCLMLDIADDATGLYVVASPPGAAGSFYFNIPQFGSPFIVVEDNSPAASHDKQFITADAYPNSPNRDNVYVTWTVFNFTCGPAHDDYCSSKIYGSMSTDHARTWSPPEEISGINADLCNFGNFFNPADDAHACNFDQGSDPIVLPNGDLEVLFNNGNTPSFDNQQLAVHCHPTGAGLTAHLNCAPPVLVGNDVLTGAPTCNFGRFCIPGHFIRTNDYPRIGVNTDNGHLYAVWQDYRNQEWDIQMAHSYDGGLTWTEDGTVNPDRGVDHYFPAVDIAEKGSGDNVGVSYYRTDRVAGENSFPFLGFAITQAAIQTCGPAGNATCMGDYILSGGTNLAVPFDFKVIAPPFSPPDGAQAGFNGDYSSLAIPKGDSAHPIWSDTRNVDPYAPQNGVVHDEDVFTDNSGLPNGKAKASVGQIGKG